MPRELRSSPDGGPARRLRRCHGPRSTARSMSAGHRLPTTTAWTLATCRSRSFTPPAFVTTAYIIFVQPTVLGGGRDGCRRRARGHVFWRVPSAACSWRGLRTIPSPWHPRMGHNFFFVYAVVIGTGVPWQTALGAVGIAGLIFVVTARHRDTRAAHRGHARLAASRDCRRDRPTDRGHRIGVGPVSSWQLRARS